VVPIYLLTFDADNLADADAKFARTIVELGQTPNSALSSFSFLSYF
jgi:hypothetical protein